MFCSASIERDNGSTESNKEEYAIILFIIVPLLRVNNIYPTDFKLHVCRLLSLLGPSMGLTSLMSLQAAFKSASGARCQ